VGFLDLCLVLGFFSPELEQDQIFKHLAFFHQSDFYVSSLEKIF